MTTLVLLMGVIAVLAGQTPAKKTLERPTDWVTRADSGAPADAPLYFVSMPPGWHITTGPGTLLYRPTQTCLKACRIETEIFLFPGKGEGGYGVFVGGVDLDRDTGPSYEVFLLRHDGAYGRAQWTNGARDPRFAWQSEQGGHVAKALPDKPVKNVVVIDLEERDDSRHVTLSVNGHPVLEERLLLRDQPRPPLSGVVGLRVDAGVNLHVTRFDVTAK